MNYPFRVVVVVIPCGDSNNTEWGDQLHRVKVVMNPRQNEHEQEPVVAAATTLQDFSPNQLGSEMGEPNRGTLLNVVRQEGG